ncbi:MAG: DUF2182 domain-containing protein [Chitinophagaceae bacterium]|nr:DUF2182 domain-containing protein [Chitinophagaceae bacterium]
MIAAPQHENADSRNTTRLPAKFIVVCTIAFVAGVSTTAYFIRSMGDEMEMPGGWKMSMMWMRMPGETWLASGLSFLYMWLAMMVAMMMPSALPTFLKTRRQWYSLCYMMLGYFAVWLIAGAGIYVLGIPFAMAAMQSVLFSHIVPLLLGTSLIAAGAIQFTRWKTVHLLRCRSSYGCAVPCPQDKGSFRIGCKQGIACCMCCAAPMMIQLTLGIMNPLVMIVIAIAIAAEKLLPRPVITARLIGSAAILTGIGVCLL